MTARQAAENYFVRISDGHEHAISRPSIHTPFGEATDRQLRKMVEIANTNGDCIINVGRGYYRPIPGDPVDELELKEYLMKDKSRTDALTLKIACMCEAFENKRKEIAYVNKQQAERETGRIRSSEAS